MPIPAPDADAYADDRVDADRHDGAADPCGLRPEDLARGGPVTVETWLGAPARSYPRRPRTVLDVLDRAVRLRPDAPAVQGTDLATGDTVTLTTRAFADRVAAAAVRLRAAGAEPGDAVAVCAGNSVDLAVALFACARAHLVMAGLDPRLAPAAHAYALAHSSVRLVLGAPERVEALAEAVRQADVPEAPALHPLAELTAPPEVGFAWAWDEAARPAEDATFAVVYTSGTTGRPKASQVVHRASVHSGMAYARLLGLQPGERTSVVFSLTYISALHAHVLPALLSGAEVVLLDAPSPRRLVAALAEHDVAWAYAVPSVWALCLRVPGFSREALPSLRLLAAGGAPFPPRLVADLRERLPGTRLLDVYGLSETHSPGCVLLDEEFAAHPGSVGQPLDCMEAEVRGEDGRPLPTGEAGGLFLRGSLVTTGYAGDPEATARALRDGWFETGDVARLDADGFVTILDRTKDMINRGGTKVFSAEVERLLREHPAVEDAAVVAVPDPLAGEAVAAFVVPRPGATVDASAVRAHVRDGMAEHAAPRRVLVVDELPRNRVGKVDKPLLRERARADDARTAPTPTPPPPPTLQ